MNQPKRFVRKCQNFFTNYFPKKEIMPDSVIGTKTVIDNIADIKSYDGPAGTSSTDPKPSKTTKQISVDSKTPRKQRDGEKPSTPLSHHPHFYELPQKKEQELRALYKQLDVDGDGKIDVKDLTAAMAKNMPHVPHASRSAKEIMKRADRNKSRHIDFSEFVHYVLEHEKKLAVVFKDLDRNKDGYIDVTEIKNYCHELGFKISDSEAARLIRSLGSSKQSGGLTQYDLGGPSAELGSNIRTASQPERTSLTVPRMDIDGTFTIDLEEFQNFLLFCPSTDPLDLAKFWRHNLIIDIGEDSLVPEDFTEKEMKIGIWWRHLTAGAAAGAVSRTCTAPLDRIKVYLQVHASRENSLRVMTGMRYLLKEGGLKSLWRGNGVNVLKIAPESALKFMAYEQVKRCISRLKGGNKDITAFERFTAGSCAGVISQTCIYPMEVLKTRLALRKSGELNRGLIDAAFRLCKNEGLGTFYKGYVPNLCGIIPYAGIDLAVYETLKSIYLGRNKDVKEPGVLALLACGTCSSTCGQLASYPLALVRTRLQARAVSGNPSQPDSMFGQFQYILRAEGFPGLYRGITPNFMKVLPAVGISYVVYETVRKQLGVQMT